jgi:hypothetical protein
LLDRTAEDIATEYQRIQTRVEEILRLLEIRAKRIGLKY